MDNTEFDPQQLLDKILAASAEFAEKGKDYAEQTLDIPESGEEREQKLDGLKKGAITTAILVGLLGTKGGRSLTGTAIKLGGLAALGTAAYKGYQSWRDNEPDDVTPIHKTVGEDAQERAFLLIATMVSAANADGKLDDEESALLKREILDMNLPHKLFDQVSAIIDQPLGVAKLSSRVKDDEIASEVYLAARIFIDDESSKAETDFLSELVAALGLSKQLITALDAQLA